MVNMRDSILSIFSHSYLHIRSLAYVPCEPCKFNKSRNFIFCWKRFGRLLEFCIVSTERSESSIIRLKGHIVTENIHIFQNMPAYTWHNSLEFKIPQISIPFFTLQPMYLNLHLTLFLSNMSINSVITL